MCNSLQTPEAKAHWKKIVHWYEVKWNFLSCIGAIDGKHFRIVKPKTSGSLFYNYKGYCSVQMLALVDTSYCFTYVEVGAEGQLGDGGQWQHRKLKLATDKDKLHLCPPFALPVTDIQLPYVIVADNAFALDEHMLKLCNRQKMDHKQQIFNYRFSRVRRCSENTFSLKVPALPQSHTRISRKHCHLHPGRSWSPQLSG